MARKHCRRPTRGSKRKLPRQEPTLRQRRSHASKTRRTGNRKRMGRSVYIAARRPIVPRSIIRGAHDCYRNGDAKRQRSPKRTFLNWVDTMQFRNWTTCGRGEYASPSYACESLSFHTSEGMGSCRRCLPTIACTSGNAPVTHVYLLTHAVPSGTSNPLRLLLGLIQRGDGSVY